VKGEPRLFHGLKFHIYSPNFPPFLPQILEIAGGKMVKKYVDCDICLTAAPMHKEEEVIYFVSSFPKTFLSRILELL
jgi:hypothetical protein